MGNSRSLRDQYAGRPLELPPSDLPTLAEGLECQRLGISLVKLREMNAADRKATGKDTRAGVRAGKVQGGGYTFGAMPGLDDLAPKVVRPVSPVLPWSALLPDNRRTGVIIGADDSEHAGARIIVTKEYRNAKAKAIDVIREQLPLGWSTITTPVRVAFTLIEPNRSAKRDILNYQKLVCDAAKGLVYLDDSLIDDAHWKRGAVDIDRPRAEFTVSPIVTL